MIKSICIVRLSALGDVLMLVPLIRTLQDNLPDVKITWIISKPAYFLVENIKGVEFILIDKPKSLKDYWHFRNQMKHRHFDVLLATQASFRANLLYGLIKATRKIGYDTLRAKDGHGWFIHESIGPGNDHTLEGFLKFAKPLGIATPSIRWDLIIDEQDIIWAKQFTNTQSPVLVVNPAASKPERNWLVERYIEVIKYAQAQWNMNVILTGGPSVDDKNLTAAIQKEVPCINLAGKTKPTQLLALISQSTVMLCPDTGPSHMANAVGTPTIALHAVTSKEVSGPYLFRHLAVDKYDEAVEKVLKTDKTTWGNHIHGAEAMKLVTVKAVIEKLDEVMSNLIKTPSS